MNLIDWKSIDPTLKQRGLNLSSHTHGMSYQERLEEAYNALRVIGLEVKRQTFSMEEAK